MKACTFTKEQKAFVLKHYKTMPIYKMAIELETNDMFIARNMKFLGLVSGLRAKKTVVPELTDEQQRFVIRNSRKMTISEMAREMGERFYTVNKFVKKNKLKVLKKDFYRYEPIIKSPPAIKQDIVRPPAVYSNPQWA